VPVALAKGWGGLDEVCGVTGMAACMAPASRSFVRCESVLAELSDDLSLGREIDKDVSASAPRGVSSLGKAMKSFVGRMLPNRRGEALEKLRAEHRDPLQDLLALQSADGWFDWPGPILSPIVPNIERWEKQVEESVQQLTETSLVQKSKITRTAMALVALEQYFPQRETLWHRAAQKALRWLANETGTDASKIQDWLKELGAKLPASP
jgi:hypothetical protein